LLLLEKSRKDHGGWGGVGLGAVLFSCRGEEGEIGEGRIDDRFIY